MAAAARSRIWREPNPVLIKELRARFRGPRAFAALTSFLMLLAGFAWLWYWMQAGRTMFVSVPYGYNPTVDAAEVGRAIFAAVAFVELVFMAFVGPALAFNAVSGEVERQTFDLLLATPLSGWAILRGKVGSAMAYVLLLIFSALPVMSLAFLFGGVPAVAVAQAQLTVLVSGLLFVTIGAFYSTVTRRTARSAILSYLTTAAVCVGQSVFIIFFSLFSFHGRIVVGGVERIQMLVLETSPLMSMATATGLRGQPMGAGSGPNSAALFWAQATAVHLLAAAMLYVLAGARIRGAGRGALASVLALIFLLGLWAAWVVAAPVAPGTGGP